MTARRASELITNYFFEENRKEKSRGEGLNQCLTVRIKLCKALSSGEQGKGEPGELPRNFLLRFSLGILYCPKLSSDSLRRRINFDFSISLMGKWNYENQVGLLNVQGAEKLTFYHFRTRCVQSLYLGPVYQYSFQRTAMDALPIFTLLTQVYYQHSHYFAGSHKWSN